MTKEELKKEGKLYANKLFDAEEQAYLHDMVVRVYVESAEPREKRIAELESQIEKMKAELHHRLVSSSHDDSDCLDKIVGLDRLWQFGEEF